MKLNHTNNRVATPFGDIQFDVDNLFDQFFGPRANGKMTTGWSPRVSISETDQGYQLLAELPGVDPESVNLEMHDNLLELSGTKSLAELPEGSRAIREERLHGEFKRVFEFGKQVDTDKIDAHFEHGLLTVSLPKSEAVLPRRIEVKVAK